MNKIKVLVVDDSAVFRALLTQLINSDPELEVVAAAEDPYEARQMIKQYNPDVLTLDIEMPKMNGVQFLR
ncbi:response regulator, partial [Vibrio genomosp. F10]